MQPDHHGDRTLDDLTRAGFTTAQAQAILTAIAAAPDYTAAHTAPIWRTPSHGDGRRSFVSRHFLLIMTALGLGLLAYVGLFTH